MNRLSLAVLTVIAVLLSGCGKETMPEPSASTCAPDAFQKFMSELRDEANRIAFADACKSFNKAKSMRDWEFKPSPADDF